jgi:large subunit ribosomal protein L13
MKTTMNFKDQKKKWIVVDATGQKLGRLSTKIAHILQGKHKPEYLPHQDMGDYVVVINAEEIELTGQKWFQNMYYRHSGYPGGLTGQTAEEVYVKSPEKLIELAVWGMLPKNRLRKPFFNKLKVYAKAEHPHEAQQPEMLAL